MKWKVAVSLLVAGLSLTAVLCRADSGVASTTQAQSARHLSDHHRVGQASAQPAASDSSSQTQADNLPQLIRSMAYWIVVSHDHEGMSFIIVDKVRAEVFLFDESGQFLDASPALLGLARGDSLSPGMGLRKLSSIQPAERTTPAGRFAASLDKNVHGDMVLWIDDDSGVALHPVITSNPSERRIERLASKTPDDNRITYGCINVDATFFEKIVVPRFLGTGGIVYILPEVSSIDQIFGSMAAEFVTRIESRAGQ